MFWDFIQQRPETTHHTLKLFSDIGSPESMRMINGSVLYKTYIHYITFIMNICISVVCHVFVVYESLFNVDSTPMLCK